VKERPKTFWNTINQNEYGFWANVNPKQPHRRWSQATERKIVDNSYTTERIATQKFNGYEAEMVRSSARASNYPPPTSNPYTHQEMFPLTITLRITLTLTQTLPLLLPLTMQAYLYEDIVGEDLWH
jgi:hypothetical protein